MQIELIRWEPSFYTDFFQQSNDEELYRNMSDAFPKTIQQCKDIVEGFVNSDDSGNCLRAILVDGKIAGCIGAFLEKDVYRKSAELAYWIGRDYRGRGIAPRAIKQFIDLLFARHDLVRVYARPYAYNKASCRVLEKTGFTLEGVIRKSVYKNNQMHDSAMYVLIRKLE